MIYAKEMGEEGPSAKDWMEDYMRKYAEGRAAVLELEWMRKILHLALNGKEYEFCVAHLKEMPSIRVVIHDRPDPLLRTISTEEIKEEQA